MNDGVLDVIAGVQSNLRQTTELLSRVVGILEKHEKRIAELETTIVMKKGVGHFKDTKTHSYNIPPAYPKIKIMEETRYA